MSDFLSFHLTDSFIEPYQNKEVDWGFPIGGGNSLSELTFVLKYSRKKEDGTKERWWEVCRRCVEGMYSILKDHAKHYGTTWNEFKAQKSAQDAFDRMFHFKWTPPGRGMQHMGTRSIIEQRNMARLVNCSAIGSDKISTHSAYRATMPFVRFMEMSMNGVGVGVSTAGAGKITLHQPNEEVEVFAIPDTREGWAASLGILLESFFFKDRNTVEFDYSQIRPEGAALHSFGGVASGHRPLQKMHERVTERLSGRDGELLTSRDIADIINLAGKACTAGGTRRSATILFGEKDDEDYINLKNWNLPENDYRTGADGFAWASNNSVTVNSSDDLDDLIDLVAVNGEPGFLWVDMIQKYGRLADAPDYKDYRATLSNPCFSGDTLIAVADGRGAVPIRDLAESGKDVPVFSMNPFDGSVEIKWGRRPRSTGFDERVLEIELSDGSNLRVTPAHKFRVFEDDLVVTLEASDLVPGMGLPVFTSGERVSLEIQSGYRQEGAALGSRECEICKEAFVVSYYQREKATCSTKCALALGSRMGQPVPLFDREAVEVVAIKEVENETVYNITVDDFHTVGVVTRTEDERLHGIYAFNCGEIPLEGQGELCNLSEIYPTNHETYEDFVSTLKHAYMYTKVVTLLTTPWPETNEVNLRNRRVGISMTGLALFVETRGWSTLTEWQDGGYKELKRLDQKYSEWLGVRESIRLTTVKPAGCRPAESLTTTSAGILTLAEIMEEHPEDSEWATVNDLEVLRADGSTSISKSYDNGKSEVLKLSLTYGVELLATPEHKWFIARHYNGSTAPRYKEIQRWVETKDIQVDDVLEIQPSTYIKDTHSSLRKINMRAITMQSNAQGITQPLEMNEDLAWLLGYLWGDGAQSPSGYRIRFSDENMYNLERVNSIIEDHFGISGTIRGVGRGRSDFELSISSKQLWHWFIGQGFWKYYDDGTLDIIPRIIRSSSRSDIISFVAGLIDSDGCANITNGDQRYVQISNSVPRFTVHLQHVMWSVGLVVGRSFMNGSEKNGHWGHGCYSMSICGGLSDGESLKELCERSGKVRMMVEKNPTSRWASKVTQVAGRVKSVDSVGEMETFDIEVPDGNWYLNGAFKSHNSTSLVTSVTPGVHWPTTSNYHLRRIRFLHTDPLVNILEKAGYHVEPDQGDPDSTVVVTFPTKGVNIRSEREVSVWEKAALAVSCQRYWSDNMVSCTLSFLPHEVKELSPLLSSYRGQMKSASFLPIDESGTTYAQAPYEPVSEADALEWMSRIQPLDEESLYGNTMNDFIEDKFCTTESCEIPQR